MIIKSKANIFILQETLGKGVEVEAALNSLLPGWHFSAIDSIGHSGGLAVGFREGKLKITNQWGMKHVMGIDFQSPEFAFPLTLINIYGPFQGRVSF